jgi:hypothetical protein
MTDDSTATDDELLARGQFGLYHLRRAKRALDRGDFKEALYQAGASLSHEPHLAEAKAIRDAAKKKK